MFVAQINVLNLSFLHIFKKKLGKRTGLGFGLVLMICGALATIEILRFASDSDLDRHRELAQKHEAASDWLVVLTANSRNTVEMLKTDDPENKKYLENELIRRYKQSTASVQRVKSMLNTEKEKELFAIIVKKRSAYREARKTLITVADTGDSSRAKSLADQVLVPALEAYVQSVKDLRNHYEKEEEGFTIG